MKPVYMITGFLESGKTEFITFTIAQPYFQIRGTTLILLCEQGETEYDPKLLKRSRAVVEVIETEEDFNLKNLMELEKRHKPERIIIEYNGMWNIKDLKLPIHWRIEQQITTIDATTFPMYYTNMKSQLSEMLRKSEMIIMNRCDGIEDLGSYKRNMKALNQRADIILENKDGEVDEIFEDDLPYSLDTKELDLDDSSYGIWYLDSLDHLERYEGKTLSFVAQVLIPPGFDPKYFVPGRKVMTCCAEDMTFLGFPCKYEGADQLKNKQWVKVKATVHREYWKDFEGEGPVLHAISVEPCKAPREEIISFS